MRRRTRKRLRVTAITLAAVAAFVAVGQIRHTPDVTRERIEHDMAGNYANELRLAGRINGHPLTTAVAVAASCDKGGPTVADEGPGRNWICNVRYADPATHAPVSVRYELQVRGEACYIAIDPALIEKPSLTDAATGASVPNPLAQFDGCFEVYDNRTSITG